MKILIVDDQPDARYLLQVLLTGHGHDVAVTTNGQEALDYARANPPHLIISDILMPIMDGFRLCREIRQDSILKDTIFIFYTATYTQQSDADFAMKIGADDFIRKPAEPSDFMARIEAVVFNASHAAKKPHSNPENETEVLRLYNERLVAKLEKRSLDLQKQIFERESAERSLREAYEIIRLSPAVAFLWRNVEGWPVDYVSDNVETVFGYSVEEMQSGNVPFAAWIHPDDLDRVSGEVAAGSLDPQSPAFNHLPYRVITKRGITKWVDDRTVVRRDKSGTITHYQGILIDVSDRIEAEQAKTALEAQLRQTQKLESIGTLASGVAHEINNPLTGIINYADLIQRRIEDADLKEYAHGIMEEGDRIAKIVRSLLSFARQDTDAHSPADLRDIIDASLALVEAQLKKDRISLLVDVPKDLPRVRCRSQQIQQVIVNLLINARDALNLKYPEYDANKSIRIVAHPITKNDGSWVRTTVEDHGTGIPADVIASIFDPFFTTKPREKGTGLGLSVSFGIVREHHGELTVDSIPGVGTSFHMDLQATQS